MAEEEAETGQDIFYVHKKSLESLKEKLKKDAEIMMPVDMRGVGEDFDDVEQMVEKLGPKGTAEAFVKAKEYFDANKDKEEESERAAPMTAAEWRKVLEDDVEGEEEEMMEDEEEDCLEDPEEEDEANDEDAKEPEAKKAKTD